MDHAEQHRHRCEVRQVLRWRRQMGSEWAKAYLDKHPRQASIEPDVRAQWAAGNRGEHDDWR